MSKERRIQFRGATYHVMSRGNRKARIFEDDWGRREFLSILADALERDDVECPSYCLMGNHYHFVAHTPRGNIARFMKVVNGRYTQYVNRRHRWTSHLFEGPYKALVIDDTCYLRAALAYVARNPVEAGFVATPEQWKWSSYAGMMGLRVSTIRRAHVVHGYLLSEIARCLGIHPTTISRLLAQSRNRNDRRAR